FDVAADPARFVHLGPPHRVRTLYQSLWRPTGEERLRLATGEYDPLLGRSHYQVAMASRSRHRSQDMGQDEPIGPHSSVFELMAGQGGAAPSLFAGIDTSVAQLSSRVPAAARVLGAYQDSVYALRSAFNPLARGELVPRLARAHALLDRAIDTLPGGASEERSRLEAERADLRNALRLAAGLVTDVTADAARVVPGDS